MPGHDNLEVDEWLDEDQFTPRYNIAPRTQAPVLRRQDPGPSNVNVRYILQSMKWGLVPHWSKFEDKTLSTTNARSENLVEGGGMWVSMKGRKRCAILCQGYYEWLSKGKDKLPHFTKHKDGRLMLMAGLYDCVTLEGQSTPLWTFAVVTTSASKEFEWLHDRQPVILSSRESLDKWLDTSSQTWSSELSKLVEPYHNSSAPLECYQVPKEVGKVGTESSTFIDPISNRKDGIQAMFSKQRQSQGNPISTKSSPLKRQQSDSPVPESELVAEFQMGVKKRKTEEDVLVVEGSSTITNTERNTDGLSGLKPSPSPQKSRKKAKHANDESTTKITAFFRKS